MESSNPNPNSNPNQNPNPNPNPSTFFFSPSTVRNLPSQDKLPQEFLARYSPDFQYVEALLSSQSPDHQYLDQIFQGSPNKQLSPPKGLDPQYDQPNKQYNNDYYEPEEYDENAPFTTEFPRAKDYLNFQSLLETFPHLQNLNDPFFDIEAVSPDAHFYIMRSSNDDNIHKAIKYHIWTTTTSGKNVLSRAWREFKDKGRDPEVFLIFSVVNSNQFLGIAKLDSDIVHNETFKYWWEPCKWFGVFHIKWLFVKDIHHAKFEHLKQEVYQHVDHNNMKTPTLCSVINLRDSTKINAKNGKQILTIFAKHPMKPNIFDSFAYMDRREDQLRAQRDSEANFNKVWEEYIAAYQLHPDLFRPQTNQPHYYKKDFKKNNQHNSNEYYQQNNYYKGPKQYHHHHNQNQNTGGNQQSNNPQYSQEGYEGGGGGNYRGNRRGGRGNSSRGRGYAGRGGRGGTGGGRGPRFYANKEDKGQGTGSESYQNYEKNDQWQQYNKGFYEGEKK